MTSFAKFLFGLFSFSIEYFGPKLYFIYFSILRFERERDRERERERETERETYDKYLMFNEKINRS
jgi:hypothetical protein